MAGKINIKRWIDVVFLGFVSFFIVVLLSHIPFLEKQLSSWAYLITNLECYIRFGIYILLIVLVVLILQKFYVVNPKRLKNIKLSLYYPSITASILICGLLLLIYTKYFSIVTMPFIHAYFVVFLLLYLILLFLLCSIDASTKRPETKSADENIIVPDWARKNEQHIDFYIWINSEKPIVDEKDDKSNRKIYADRIAHKLKRKDEEQKNRNHICIVGPFGSGKTSVWEIASKSLKDDDVIFVAIDGWGRSNESAAAQIIDEIIYALSEYVDCAAIKTVPGEYMDSLSGADFIGANSLAKILALHQRSSPRELIEKIDKVLVSIGKRFVVVLEDFDRNPESEKGINEIAALLDRLRELKSIDFILCVSPSQQSNILSRISTYREDIVNFDSRKSIEETINLMELYAEFKKMELFISHRENLSTFYKTIDEVVKTPRELKYILRRSLNAWLTLAGEVNPYDLIIVNVLRYSCQDLYYFLQKNFDDLKNSENDNNKKKTLWNYFSKIDSSIGEGTFSSIVKVLFTRSDFSLQRLRDEKGLSYFKRIISEDFDNKYSDQRLVKNLRELNHDNGDSIFSKSPTLDRIVESDELSYKFLKLAELPSSIQSKIHVSEFTFCRFIISIFNFKKAQSIVFYQDEIVRISALINASNMASDHSKKMMTYLIKEDLGLVLSLLKSNDAFLNVFYSVYLDSATDLSTRAHQLINAIKGTDPKNHMIYNTIKSSPEWLALYIELMVHAFSSNPSDMFHYIIPIFVDYVLPVNASDCELWAPHTTQMIEVLDKWSSTGIQNQQANTFKMELIKLKC